MSFLKHSLYWIQLFSIYFKFRNIKLELEVSIIIYKYVNIEYPNVFKHND